MVVFNLRTFFIHWDFLLFLMQIWEHFFSEAFVPVDSRSAAHVPQFALRSSRSTVRASQFAHSLFGLFFISLSLSSCSEFIVIVVISQVYIKKHLRLSAGRFKSLSPAFVPTAEYIPGSILHHGFPCMDYTYDSLKKTYKWVSSSLWIGIIELRKKSGYALREKLTRPA